jgi:hypothetical protein
MNGLSTLYGGGGGAGGAGSGWGGTGGTGFVGGAMTLIVMTLGWRR